MRSSINYWRIPREWAGETAFILGGGPSLRGFDASVLFGRRVIAINNAGLDLAPWAEVLYFCDAKWWGWHSEEVLKTFTGRWIVTPSMANDRVQTILLVVKEGLSKEPHILHSGHNSGYQAINLAYHLGAGRIVLLGYDMNVNGNGQTHYHEGHPTSMPPEEYCRMLQMTMHKNMLPKFGSLVGDLAAAGVEVINANPNSELKCWPRKPLSEIL